MRNQITLVHSCIWVFRFYHTVFPYHCSRTRTYTYHTLFTILLVLINMSSVTNARSASKSSKRTRNGSTRYGLRSKSESAASNTPKEDIYETPLKFAVTPQATTPSTLSSGVCVVCKGRDDLRSLNFRNAVTEFSDNIEAFKQLTKSFNDNNSTLSHALDTIKHFIIHIKPDKINDSFACLDSG